LTLATDLLETVYEGRAIAGELGFRPHSAAIVIVSSSGFHTGDGSRTEIETAITEADGQSPRIRWMKDDEVALGLLPKGSVEVGPITPEYTSLSLLNGADMNDGDVRLLRITGPNHPTGADYAIKGVSADRALRYMITAVPVGSQEG
jgi:hypothetical protein